MTRARAGRRLSGEISKSSPVARRVTVLVVEDDERVRSAACTVLTAAGYEVLSAGGSEEALNLAQAQQVQILFTDVTLPGRNGFRLALCLRGLIPALRVLLASGYPEYSTRSPQEESCNFFRLAKPYSASNLLEKIARMTH